MKSCFGQNEDYSLGDSLSHRSEEIYQRNVCVCVCARAPSAYLFLVKGVHAVKYTFGRGLLLVVRNRYRHFVAVRKYKIPGS